MLLRKKFTILILKRENPTMQDFKDKSQKLVVWLINDTNIEVRMFLTLSIL